MADLYGEIQYETADGLIHSDMSGDPSDPEIRAHLHACLDEWLDKGARTGGFYIGNAHLDDDCSERES